MAASYISALKMLKLLKEGHLYTIASETICGHEEEKTVFEHFSSLFKMNTLSEEEKKIMMFLALIGIQGVPAVRFREWANLPSYEIVNKLIKRSWVRKENGDKFSLHPLVKEVVCKELSPNIDNCREFLNNIAEFCCGSWMRNYQENVLVKNNILECLNYLDIDAHEIQILEPCIGFLWQVGKFEESIKYFHKLYDSCLKVYGIENIRTGIVAKALGGAYFNSRDLHSSISWYEQGLRSMQLAKIEEGEDLALAYEKVARCYTWAENPNQDLEKAKDYFEIALKIRKNLRDTLKQGKRHKRFSIYKSCNLNDVEAAIGGNYMEMGRMYQVAKDYEKALDYAIKYEEQLSTYKPGNFSGIAYSHYDQGVCYYYLGVQEEEKGNGTAAIKIFQQAERELIEALKINKKMRGVLAFDTIDNQEYLADVYMAISKEMYKKASDGYIEAKTMAEGLMGENCNRVQSIKKKIQKIIDGSIEV